MKKLSIILGGLFVASVAQAGGYQLNDYSVTGLGRSYAGQGIMGDDYSAIAFNPAGMTLMKRSGIQTGLSFVNLNADVESIDSRYANQHRKMDFWVPIPQFFAQYNLNDKWSLGMGVYAPFGLKTDYDADWFASDTAILSKLDIIDINASIAYKLTDKWSIGASAIARYIYGHMTNTLSLGGGTSDFELDGWTKTAQFGVMYEPTENTRFGLAYRLRSTQQVKGDHKIEGNSLGFNQTATGWASPALPETVTLSAYHRYKKVGFSGTARWTHWSQSFPEFSMRSDSRLFQYLSYKMPAMGAAVGVANGQKVSKYNYDNTWTLTAGLDYYYCKNLTFRFGAGWDESPTHSDNKRTIRIPDNDRWWTSIGASYMKNNWQLDIGYAHMFGKTGKALEASDPNAVHVKYKNMQSHILGIQYQYKF